MTKNKLKVGFDLDGVILYSPIRIFRPIIAFIKKYIFKKKKEVSFYYPKSKLERFLWHHLHKTSFIVSSGLDEIKQMVKRGDIEAYIITARYSFLGKEFEDLMKKLGIKGLFTDVIYNRDDEQPHIYKQKQIEKLGLDIFIDDNWNIVEYLNTKKIQEKKPVHVYWVYNILDRAIPYNKKIPHLKAFVAKLKDHLQ